MPWRRRLDALHLSAALNDAVRGALQAAVVLSGQALRVSMWARIATFERTQRRLARRHGIGPDTPILRYGPEVQAAVEAFAARCAGTRFAFTSGSTATPKKIAFSPARLRRIKQGSFSVAARLFASHPGWRTGLFILASLATDDSLTSLLLDDGPALPPRALGLLMPGRMLREPSVRALAERYGAAATRLWLLVLANPGLVYSTNPSTLAVFLAHLGGEWERTTALVRDFVRDPQGFEAPVQRVAARVVSRGFGERAARIAAASAPLGLADCVPALRAYCCWDGGYVRPFLEQVRAALPPERVRLVPMYSMSTETVETLSYFDGPVVRFLPVAPGVLYEFLPEETPDDPTQLVPAYALEPGATYSMVVTDPYGLRRYQTEDLFRCEARVGAAPDLRFQRRQGLSYSFTGEKLTDRHLEEAFARLRAETPALVAEGIQLTCVPSQPAGANVPGYVLVLAHPARELSVPLDPRVLARRLDALLGEINSELRAKLETGRLAPTRGLVMPYDRLASRLDPKTRDTAARTWESQFKLLPLYRRLWEARDDVA